MGFFRLFVTTCLVYRSVLLYDIIQINNHVKHLHVLMCFVPSLFIALHFSYEMFFLNNDFEVIDIFRLVDRFKGHLSIRVIDTTVVGLTFKSLNVVMQPCI